MTMNRAAFFAAVRSPLFGGCLTDPQVKGLDTLLNLAPAELSREQLAYCLATAFHETRATMQPVIEDLTYKTATRICQVWPTRFPTEARARPFVGKPEALANEVYGGRMGNTQPGDGWRYRGRGFAQITGRENYAKAGRALLADLEQNPDQATRPDIAAQILYEGMTAGWFTGARLADYFTAARADPRSARKIINRLDRADDIAGYYRNFLAALIAAETAPPPDIPAATPPIPVVPIGAPPDVEPLPPQPARSGGLFLALKALLEALFGKRG